MNTSKITNQPILPQPNKHDNDTKYDTNKICYSIPNSMISTTTTSMPNSMLSYSDPISLNMLLKINPYLIPPPPPLPTLPNISSFLSHVPPPPPYPPKKSINPHKSSILWNPIALQNIFNINPNLIDLNPINLSQLNIPSLANFNNNYNNNNNNNNISTNK